MGVAIGLQSELKAVCSRTSRKTRCPPTYDAKEWVARTSHWAEGARAWTFLPPREKQAAVDCDLTIGEAPIDYHAWGPFISQDKGVLNDDFDSVIESVEALLTDKKGSKRKARMSSYSKLTGGKKTESGKYKKIKGRIFLKAHFSKKRGYKNVESNSRAVTLNLPQFLPGASASHKASQVTSLMDFLSQEITSAATSDDRVSWSASIWDLWNFIHRMLAGSAGGDLDETCSISTGVCFGKPLRHLEALNQRCFLPKCPKAPR